ncbi:MAG: GGDEF domain-containing protein [Desulfobacteraceae bacterium]|nr:GGDEF domain-containing protein [Desulfobacteraceae bacterium]
MGSLDLLSEAIIETLKEFSSEKRALTVFSLRRALSARKELSHLFRDSDPDRNHEAGTVEFTDGSTSPLKTLARVSLRNDKNSQKFDFSLFRKIRGTLQQILTELEPISRDESLTRLSEVERYIQACHALDALADHDEDIVGTVKMTVDKAVEQINAAHDFLAELSEDLMSMEKQLFSYQTENRETFKLQGQFCDNLLTHTAEMHQAVSSSRGIEDTRNFIASKLSLIGKAIEMKQMEDETRLQQADSRIAELQLNMRCYNEQILKVTERANALEKEALLDSLMEIHNRRAYDIEIRECLRNFHKQGKIFSLLLIDVDHFKSINDKYGHRAGDKCLQEIAKIVGASLRKTDFLARYGGEELVAILPGSTSADARNIAEKIRGRIDKTRFYYQEEVIPLTISLGVTEVAPEDTEPEMPFVRVDEAMYQAKKGGRNKVCVI